jgi:glycine/D-amino acid oxidase-like deaminating enzyme
MEIKLGKNSADIIILGAGVMGASIAFHLAKRGAGRILVLDKDHVGKGGTGRSSALVRMHYSFAPEVELAVKSLEVFQNWKEVVGETGEFRKTGFVRIVPREELSLLEQNVAMQKRLGVKTEIISCAELSTIEPDWNLDDEPAVAYEPDSGYGDGAIAAQDFMSAARAMGVEYRSKTRATGFLRKGDRVQGITTESGKIEAPIVVAATGPWTKPLLEDVGVDLPIENEFHQVVILRNPPDMKGGGCACIDSACTLYFRSDAHDKTLIGDFYGDRPVDPDNYPQRASDHWVEHIIGEACRRIPKLQNAEIMRGITGVYDMTPDSRPLLGEVTGMKGLYVVAGFSGMGFKISPAIGLVMAEMVTEGQAKSVDVSAFRPSRFADKKPIKGEFEYSDD